jgi:putative addiction module killer protein
MLTTMVYNVCMIEIKQTPAYSEWLASLDNTVQARIAKRVLRLAYGLTGDVKPIGSGASELRIDFGPGYRVYFGQHGKTLVIVLGGGDKSTQARDIKQALALWNSLED